MAVLVTGGAGFIGSNLVDRLLEENREVLCLDDFNNDYDPGIKRKNIEHNTGNKNFKLIEVDIRKRKELENAIKKYEINRVVHLAAKTNPRLSIKKPELYLHDNITGTTNLLELCRNLDIKNFIFGSSSSVYGDAKPPFKENDTTNPISPYAASKKSCELICQVYSRLYNIPTICLRFFTVYGPRQKPEMAIHKFTKLIDMDKEIEIYGDGFSTRDYTYVDDIIDGIMKALNKKIKFEIFNLGSDREIGLRYLVSLIEEHLSREAKMKYLPYQQGDMLASCADIAKARRMLDYKPKIKIKEGIKRFVEWYKEIKKV